MSCEVHLVLDPDQPAQVMPWRVVHWSRRIEVALPGGALGKMTVVVERSRAELHVAGRVAPLTCLRSESMARTRWALPDGGYLLINDAAFNYAARSWWFNS